MATTTDFEKETQTAVDNLAAYICSTQPFYDDTCDTCGAEYEDRENLWKDHLVMFIEGLVGLWAKGQVPLPTEALFESRFVTPMSISAAGMHGDHVFKMYAVPIAVYPSLGALLHHYTEATHWHAPSEIVLCGKPITTLGDAFMHATYSKDNWGTVIVNGKETKITNEDGITNTTLIDSADFETLPPTIQSGLRALDGTPWIDAFLPAPHKTPVIVLQAGGEHLFAISVTDDHYIVITSW